jgi:hypothetical protein
MRELITRRAVRVLAVSVVALAAAGATVGGAQATGAGKPQLQTGCSPVSATLTGSKAAVVATFEQECTEPGGEIIVHDFPVSLSRLVGGTWVVVASGDGVAAHECVGSTTYEYHGADGTTGTFACG